MQNKKRGTLLIIGGALIAACLVGIGYFFPRLKTRGGAERLGSVEMRGTPFAAHNGNIYFWRDNGGAYRVPASGGKTVFCFSRPPDPALSRTYVANDDGFYIVDFRDADLNAQNVQRPLTINSVPKAWRLQLWRYGWEENALQSIPPPARFASIAPYSAFVSGSTLYYFEDLVTPNAGATTAKNRNTQSSPSNRLIRWPLRGGQPETIARNLPYGVSNGSDDLACGTRYRPAPRSNGLTVPTVDTICRIADSRDLVIPGAHLLGRDSLAATPQGAWWLQSVLNNADTKMGERLAGQTSPHQIEPPLRQSEEDIFTYHWIRRVGDRLYLRCTVRSATNISDTPQNVGNADALSEPKLYEYIIRLNPALAGQPGFWGRPLPLPEGADNLLLDNDFLYFTRAETDQNILFALQNVVSSSAPAPTMRTALYRLPLL